MGKTVIWIRISDIFIKVGLTNVKISRKLYFKGHNIYI